jgi:hypothetical protein
MQYNFYKISSVSYQSSQRGPHHLISSNKSREMDKIILSSMKRTLHFFLIRPMLFPLHSPAGAGAVVLDPNKPPLLLPPNAGAGVVDPKSPPPPADGAGAVVDDPNNPPEVLLAASA